MKHLSQNMTSLGQHNVKYPVQLQHDGQGYLTSEPKEGSVGIVMIQEWWGLNKSITITADNFAKAGNFVVLAPDLYRGKVAKSNEEAGHLMSNLDWNSALKNIASAVHWLKEKGCKKVGITGFCMGGALTLAACSMSSEIDAGASFYGVPDFDEYSLGNISCPMLAHFGENDHNKGFSDAATRKKLESLWKKAQVDYEIKVWPGAGHAFMNQDGPNYKPDVAKEALQETVNWFKSKLT